LKPAGADTITVKRTGRRCAMSMTAKQSARLAPLDPIWATLRDEA
jgi:hypothetical protein